MAKRKILVITDHMPWGHRAIAKAIFNYLKTKEKKNNWEVSYSQVVAETSKVGTLYNFVYQYFPASNKVLHKLSSNKLVYKTVIDFATLNIDNLEVVVKKYKPDLIISAYFFHSHALEEMRRVNGYNYKLWTIAADPWTINPLSFVPGADLNLVYDKAGVKLAVKWGVEKDRVMETGWWTRQEMYQECDRTKMRKKLGVTDDRPVLFVSGGSLGSAAVGKLLPTLMTLNREMMVVFNSGTGKFVFEMVEQYKKMYERVMKGKRW